MRQAGPEWSGGGGRAEQQREPSAGSGVGTDAQGLRLSLEGTWAARTSCAIRGPLGCSSAQSPWDPPKAPEAVDVILNRAAHPGCT